QRIHDGDGTRTHGEDVAQDAANPSGCALEGLDERRMIVRLDLEGAGPAIADVDDARIFPGSLHHATAVRGQPLQVHARGFVRAVFAPHHAENAQLGEGWLAAQRLQDAVVFFRRNSVVAKHFWSNGGFFGETGGAIDWVHGEEGSSIVARAIGLGKDFSSALLLRFTPLIAASQAFPAMRLGSRRVGEWHGCRPESDLTRIRARYFANLQRFAFRATGDFFRAFVIAAFRLYFARF